MSVDENTLAAHGIVGEMRRKYLDGDRTLQPRVPRPIHFAHSARAQRRDDFVGPSFVPEVRDMVRDRADYR